jgi:hypothetical protein
LREAVGLEDSHEARFTALFGRWPRCRGKCSTLVER